MYLLESLISNSSIGPSNLLNDPLSNDITLHSDSATTLAALGSFLIKANSPKNEPLV